MKKKFTTTSVLVMFLISTLALPLALAEETTDGEVLVGIVYRGWTQQECEQTFGKSYAITNNIDSLKIDEQLKQSRGPLFYNGAETGCYCAQDARGDWLMNEQKTSCQLCSRFEKNAVYYTDEKAVVNAVIKVKDEDIGCRCSNQEGNKDFSKVENGKCVYRDTTKEKATCQAEYGTSGVKVCAGISGETSLGTAQGISCCCDSGYKKDQDIATGKYKCTALPKGTTAIDSVCNEAGKVTGFGDFVGECSEALKNFDYSKADDALKEDYSNRFLGAITSDPNTGASIPCCCKVGYIYTGGTCVPDVDECGGVVAGSVKKGRADAGELLISETDEYASKKWQKDKIEQLKNKKLTNECYCKSGYLPADRAQNPDGEIEYVLDSCIEATTCEQIALGSVPSTSENADKNIKVDTTWESTIIAAISKNKLECNCPNGTIAYDSNSNSMYDVCALENPRCLESSELSAFLTVGICGARKKGGEEYPISFAEATLFSGLEDVVVKDKEQGGVAKTAKALWYGLTRAVGARDLWYLFQKGVIDWGGCNIPQENSDFSDHVEYTECLAKYPCDQMPLKTLGLGSNVAKVAYGGWLANKVGDLGRTQMLAELGEIVGKSGEVTKLGKEITTITENTAELANRGLANFKNYEASIDTLRTQAASLTGYGTASAKADLLKRAADLEIEAVKDFGKFKAEVASAKRGMSTVPGKLSGMTDEFTKTADWLDNYGITNSGGSPLAYTGTSPPSGQLGDTILGSVGQQYGRATDGATDAANLLKEMDLATDFRNFNTRVPGNLVDDVLRNADDVVRLATKSDDVAKSVVTGTKMTSKVLSAIGKWKWVKSTKSFFTSPAFMKMGAIGKAIAKSPIGQGLKAAGKAIGKVANPALWIYGAIDGLSAAYSYGTSKEVLIEPGEYDLMKTSINTPFTIKGRDGDKMAGIASMVFVSKGFGLGTMYDGGLIDASGEAKVEKPPNGLSGLTYKCEGSCSCSGNIMNDCRCYPIANHINVELGDKVKEKGTISGGMTI